LTKLRKHQNHQPARVSSSSHARISRSDG
jgi:hypothetical protein